MRDEISVSRGNVDVNPLVNEKPPNPIYDFRSDPGWVCDHGISLEAVCSECSKIRPPAIACHYCGKFTRYEDVRWEEGYLWNPTTALEPAEQVPVCHRCRKDDA